MTSNEKLLAAIKARTNPQTPFGRGILTADRYVKTIRECVGVDACYRYAAKSNVSFQDVMDKAAKTLVYSNDDMEVENKVADIGNGFPFNKACQGAITYWTNKQVDGEEIEVPKNTLMMFRHILTTPRKDRDGDILRTEGATVDPKMPLLWQHVHTLPIGKMIAIAEHTNQKLSLISVIVDMNELSHDAAVMIDSGMGRFSHGFRALEFDELKEDEGEVTSPGGFDIKKFEIMEASLVSVPSNTDAETEEVLLGLGEGGKLTSPLMKEVCKGIRERRPVQIPVTKEIPDEDKFRSGSTKEQAKEGCSCSSKEADGDAKETKEASHPKVKRYGGNVPNDSKHFDVDKEELIASKLEYEWCSRFLSVPVKELIVVHTSVPEFRIGTFLTGMREETNKWNLHDTRNITWGGKEIPPDSEVFQLNSRLSDSFLVEGLQFWKCNGHRLVTKLSRGWNSITLTVYSVKDEGSQLINKCWDYAIQNNFLKGEAFKLSGGFLERRGQDWSDVFLSEKNINPVRKSVELLNSKGKKMPNRGMIFMGKPGTGKTLSGRIMMNQAKCSFIWVAARDFWRMGATAGLCSAFDLAREISPAIIFVEDVDNWLDSRTVDILKTEMDGIDQSSGVLTILTTNYPERLPEALIDRPGRFHDVLEFELPNSQVRGRMLKAWLPAISDSQMLKAVKRTEGYSGAHMYELTHFAKNILEEDSSLDVGTALDKALNKIEEQREIITQSQLSGSNYRPRSTELDWAKRFKSVRTLTFGKAGRTLSGKNMQLLKDVRDNVVEIQEKETLSRGGNALCKECMKNLDEVIGTTDMDEETTHAEFTVKDAIATLVSKGSQEDFDRMRGILESLTTISNNERVADQFRALTRV